LNVADSAKSSTYELIDLGQHDPRTVVEQVILTAPEAQARRSGLAQGIAKLDRQ
jgi:hypothetical protein